jgi:hypothetical protein
MRNRKISHNFHLYEFIEAALPPQAVELNWEHISQFKEELYLKLASELQKIRNQVNIEFRTGNAGNEIGLRITSGFRCLEWELLRGRTGTSQHCVGAAADVQPVGCSDRMAVEIMYWLWDQHWPRQTGWPGGFAMSKPIYTQGGIIERIGFLHYDLRGQVARWEY